MTATKKEFQTEVKQLLDLVIHSLYSNKDIFLRELISNSSDAIDRARFESLSNQEILEEDHDWKIKIIPNKEAKTLTIVDNGIGMSAEEVETNIGTIARSGTKQFMSEIKEKGETAQAELIGQFGVGFYSAFMVADKVTMITRRACDKTQGTRWESDGSGSYTVDVVEKEKRGTEITLHLKEEMEEYLEEWKIRKIVKQYSDFVEHPVCMDIRREDVERDEEGKPVEGAEPEVSITEETLNSRKAIWSRSASEVKEEEYNEFYKHISHDFQDPLETVHWNVEGTTEFRALLYLPQRKLPDMMMAGGPEKSVQLYIKRVFITDNCEALVPQYLRFLHGVVDSSDLPLNVSREVLQEDKIVRVIQKNIVKKILSVLDGMKTNNREKYVGFWKEFGSVIKEGMHFDFANREKIQEIILFQSSRTESGEFTTLEEYVERMPEDQKEIYFITGESRAALENSPYLEALRKKDYEVLFMTDPIDEWVVQSLQSYKEKSLKSIAKGDIDLDNEDEKKEKEEQRKKDEESFKDLSELIQKQLEDEVKEVRLSNRLTDSACCLVSDEFGMGIHMERLMKSMNKDMPKSKRILEINPGHPLVMNMQKIMDKGDQQERLQNYVHLLFDQALLTAGIPIQDPLQFTQRISNLMANESETLI